LICGLETNVLNGIFRNVYSNLLFLDHYFYQLMKRKTKQWWSSIPSISIKRKITSHL